MHPQSRGDAESIKFLTTTNLMFQTPHRCGNRIRTTDMASCSPFGPIRRPLHAPHGGNTRGLSSKASLVRNQDQASPSLEPNASQAVR